MDIKQILRDAINSEAAKILKEEYGIDFPSDTKEAVSKDQDSSCTYQAVLTERGGFIVKILQTLWNQFMAANHTPTLYVLPTSHL